ncbi:nitrogen fixation protein NifX [Cereibacter changlensis]|uniref:nitrogen fixation protein NifX n=1 Tax=Cereibacter changlensis TaxID=402884 RepID=UPI00403398F8
MTDPADTPLKIAIATNDLETLNAHFGSARSFAIWEVSAGAARFVEAIGFEATAQSGKHDDLDDKITPKVAALEGCALLFVLAIGGPAAAKVVRAGVHPIKRKDPESIASVVEQVQVMLRGNPPPFLRKALVRGAASFVEEDAI